MKLTWEVQLRMSAGVPIKEVLGKPVFPWMKFPSQKTNNNRKGRQPNQGPNTQQTPNSKLRPSAGVPDRAPSPLKSFCLWLDFRFRFAATGVCISWDTSKTSAGNGLQLFSGTLRLFQCPYLLAVFTLQNQRRKPGRTRAGRHLA